MKTSNEEIKKFYNRYVTEQKKTGVNIRHRYIHKQVKKAGLNKYSNVLEIGCGIGTYTSLLCNVVTQGKIVAVDISDESIQVAKQNLKKI